MATAEVSHGRGGAGNIEPDDTKYVDGSIVRAGVEGSHGDGAYSSGRGGAGNISDVGISNTTRKDADVIPESAVRPSQENSDFHTGRGGAGNEHLAIDHEKKAAQRARAEGPPVGLADKIKGKIFGGHKK